MSALGLGREDIVMVHASMRAVRCDVNDVVRALVASLPEKRVRHYEVRMAERGVVQFEEFETSEATAHVFDAAELHTFAVEWLEGHAK